MPRYRQDAHRRDDNHREIADALEAAGWFVLDTSQAGNGCPDLFAAKGGVLVPIEVKDGAKKPSLRKLSEKEQKVHAAFAAKGVTVAVIETVEQAVGLRTPKTE